MFLPGFAREERRKRFVSTMASSGERNLYGTWGRRLMP
jgi:hypothetical protein